MALTPGKAVALFGAEGPVVRETALGGGLEGAERTKRETARWEPPQGPMDRLIGTLKPRADARGRDMVLNDGLTHGASAIHKDSIVGSQYRLNATPALDVLALADPRFTEEWSEEFQRVVEGRFKLFAEGDRRWIDASRMNTLTGLVRLGVGGFMYTGEVLATAEWLSRDYTRPLSTAIQLVAPSRLSNPNGEPDTKTLKKGVRKNLRGQPVSYCFRLSHPYDNVIDTDAWRWREVPAEKPWGRPQVLHVLEQVEVDQTRGIADIVSALSHMKMAKTHTEISLQNAVVNASYAASLEADMPPEAVYGAMGGNTGAENFETALGSYMEILKTYFGGANNVNIDGAKVPVLPPGVKLQARSLAAPGGVGSNFEDSLHRYTAAALGLSFEEYARNFENVSYSSMRGGIMLTNRFMKARKKVVADRIANFAYWLFLEEEINSGNVPTPAGMTKRQMQNIFYQPLMREAFCQCNWIGAGAGQIDELKETQAAILRVKAGFSTYEKEIARFGDDYREIFAQRAREEGIIASRKLVFDLGTQKAGAKDRQNTLSSGGKSKDKAKKKAEAAS